MKIAWLTPFSRRSAIGHCSAAIVADLRSRVDVTVFASDLSHSGDSECWLPDADICGMLALTHEQLLEKLETFDLCVYQLGDNFEFHGSIYDLAQELPGITVLHDVVMHHFFSQYYVAGRRDRNGYVDEATFSHGPKGQAYARAVLAGAVDLAQDPALLRFNMAKSAIHRSEGVVVHSEFAYQTVASVAECPVAHIPFPAPGMTAPALSSPSAARRRHRAKLKLLTFGVVNPNKLIAEVIEALAAHPRLRDLVEYRIIGSLANANYARRVQDAIADGGLQNSVFLMGHRPEEDLQNAIAEADLVINLRNPHFGESSWSLLEASMAGKPSLVWRHGFYDEFPDDAVAKVASLSEIGPKIAELYRDREVRLGLGRRARAFALETFSTAQYSDCLLAFAERTRHNRPILRLADNVATRLIELGQPADSPAMELTLAEIVALAEVHRDDGEANLAATIGG
jgi:glycosyltransferase involved in cell wall biosynthesis